MSINSGNYCCFPGITVWAVVWWLTTGSLSFSQDYIFDIDMINVEDGLPHRNTYAVTQDTAGFIWVSTLAGISRYDGYRFKTYSNTILGIPERYSASCIAVDAANRIWYSGKYLPRKGPTYGGVINTQQDSVYTMEVISERRFTSQDVIYVGNSKVNPGAILIIVRTGIVYEYDGTIKEIYRANEPFLRNVVCEAFPDGSYWILDTTKAIRIKDGKQIRRIEFNGRIGRFLSTYPDLILKSPYAPANASYLKLEQDTFAPFNVPKQTPEDSAGLFYILDDYSYYSIDHKVLIRDKQGNTIHISDQFKSSESAKSLIVQNTFTDRQHNLWAATGNGLLKISSRKNPFKKTGIKSIIRSIYKHQEQKESRYNKDKGSRESFYKDHYEQLWIGTGLDIVMMYIADQDKFVKYKFNTTASLHLVFQNIITKSYWVGSSNGIFRFDPAMQKITPFPLPIASEGVFIRQFYQNTAGIWIISNKGIFLMDAREERIVKHYTVTNGLAFDNLNYLHEDNEGILWLGARRGGLIRWDLRTDTFRQYTRNDGLSNDNIYAIYEDRYGILWLPSDYGLMAFDKTTETTKVYLPQQGIPHEEFNTFSHFRDKDSTLYFGGLDGYISFYPGDLREQTGVSPPLYAAKVQILEEKAETFTDNTANYKKTQEIYVAPGDRILEVELTLLDYEESGENQYAYKLSGKQEQWVYTRENKITIINPPYGKYDLVVKARGASGNWSKDPLLIPMHVQAPFYMQWWFILTLTLGTIAVIIIAIRWRVSKLKKDRRRLENEVQKRTRKIAQDKQTIEKQAEDLKALDKAKSRFFTNITHEFRTPLTLILGPAEQITANDPPKLLTTRMHSIKHNARQLLGLINRLLDISKLESGQMELRAARADIVAFTRKLVQRFDSLAAEKQQKLLFHSALKAWETHFDAEKYNDIIYNLLSNALKYSPRKAVVEFLLAKAEVGDKEHIKIQVKDTGIGIVPEALPHIFDRFYQADDSTTRKGEGTGIGLALVKELVELMNGEINVESKIGKGSVFTVSLPVLPAPEHPDAVTDIPPLIPVTTPETETETAVDKDHDHTTAEANKFEVLIIEDNTEMRNYIRSCIIPEHYRITEAADGEEGIAKAQQRVPDLIISDVMMPKKDGFEVTRAIRNHIATSHIPLILLTAKASDESRLEGINRGADAYLTKPFNPKELRLRIKKLIELRKLLQLRYRGQYRELPKADVAFRKEDQFIKALNTYITDHISEPGLNVETISRHFFISRMQLYRKFNALANITLNDYIRSVRMEKAMQLLKSKELNITEVAYATGFSSVSYFSKTFKRIYGKSPSEAL